jgi:hypothetical protein
MKVWSAVVLVLSIDLVGVLLPAARPRDAAPAPRRDTAAIFGASCGGAHSVREHAGPSPAAARRHHGEKGLTSIA